MTTEQEIQSFEEYCNYSSKIDNKINQGFSSKVLEPLYEKLFKIKAALIQSCSKNKYLFEEIKTF